MTAAESNRAKSRQDTKEATGGDGRLEIQTEAMSFWSLRAALVNTESISSRHSLTRVGSEIHTHVVDEK